MQGSLGALDAPGSGGVEARGGRRHTRRGRRPPPHIGQGVVVDRLPPFDAGRICAHALSPTLGRAQVAGAATTLV